MTPDVLTAYELHGDMIAASNHVSDCVTEYERRAKEWAAAKYDVELARSQEYPKTKGTVDERKAKVFYACREYEQAELQADALKNSADRALKAALAQLSALQSAAAALRAELQLVRTDNYS
jgi:hypothetical protein